MMFAGNRSRRRVGGQVLVEYAIMVGMMLATVAILAVFLYVFRQYGGRVLDLVAQEYP